MSWTEATPLMMMMKAIGNQCEWSMAFEDPSGWPFGNVLDEDGAV